MSSTTRLAPRAAAGPGALNEATAGRAALELVSLDQRGLHGEPDHDCAGTADKDEKSERMGAEGDHVYPSVLGPPRSSSPISASEWSCASRPSNSSSAASTSATFCGCFSGQPSRSQTSKAAMMAPAKRSAAAAFAVAAASSIGALPFDVIPR